MDMSKKRIRERVRWKQMSTQQLPRTQRQQTVLKKAPGPRAGQWGLLCTPAHRASQHPSIPAESASESAEQWEEWLALVWSWTYISKQCCHVKGLFLAAKYALKYWLSKEKRKVLRVETDAQLAFSSKLWQYSWLDLSGQKKYTWSLSAFSFIQMLFLLQIHCFPFKTMISSS